MDSELTNNEPISSRKIPWERLRRPVFTAVALMVMALILRIALIASFAPEPTPSGKDYLLTMLVGLHLDLVASITLTAPLALWCLLVSARWMAARWHRVLMLCVSIFSWLLLVFLHMAEWFFFEEYRSRYNTVAIDYLLYPTEVVTNIRESYPVPAILGACALGTATLVFLSQRLAPIGAGAASSIWKRSKWAFGWLALSTALVMSVTLAEVRFSRERVVNELANNSFVAGITAALTRNLDYSAFYPTMPREEALAICRELLADDGAAFLSPESLQRHIPGSLEKPKLNVCLLLEESLGSEFWGCLGREKKTLTPHLDHLANEEGLLFTNMYADGNRTIRGMEGILASFPPLPGDSIVARDRSENVDTLARVMARDGYRTLFLYGGRGLFDHVRSFNVGNGYERLIEQKDFAAPSHTTAWGVCNEDLYTRAIEEMRTLHETGKPFLVTTLSVSNHVPFTYPKGRIKEDPNAHRRDYAVKYTDWALGQFFDAVKKEPFWKDTIFVVVADHGARVYGSQTIPIHSYEIPMLVLGPAAVQKPQRVDDLACQLDVAPTILGMIGRPYDSVFFGHDILNAPTRTNRALLHHNRSIGIYRDEHLVIFGLNKEIEYWIGNPRTSLPGTAKRAALQRVFEPDAIFQQLVREATALYQTADELYMNRKYRVQEPPSGKAPLTKAEISTTKGGTGG